VKALISLAARRIEKSTTSDFSSGAEFSPVVVGEKSRGRLID